MLSGPAHRSQDTAPPPCGTLVDKCYPLAAIERYVCRRRENGRLLDPRMRLHEQLGSRVATALPRSMRITGTVQESEAWIDLPLPESGDYVFPHGSGAAHGRPRWRYVHVLGAERLDDRIPSLRDVTGR